MANTIQMRRGTAAEATSSNPVLADGEWGYERDTKRVKIGDGVTAWNDLPYFESGAAGAGVLEYQTPITAASTTFNGTQKGLNKVYVFNSASAQTVTINADDYVVNDVINIERRGAGTVEIVQGTGVRFRGVRDVNNRFFVNDSSSIVALVCRGSNEFTAIGNLKRGYIGAVTTDSYTELREGDINRIVTVLGTGFSENMIVTSSANATLNSWTFINVNEIELDFTTVGVATETVTITYDNGQIFEDVNAISIAAAGGLTYNDYVLWLKLDETAGTTAVDESGNHSGTITSTTINQTAKVNKGYLLDSTSRVHLTGPGISVNNYPFTVEFWYKAAANNIVNYVICADSAVYKGFNIRIINQKFDLLLGNGIGVATASRKNFSSGDIVTANEWQKFTLKVTDFNTVSLKRNNVTVAFAYTNGGAGSMDFTTDYVIGLDVTNSANSVGFELDEFKVWPRLTTTLEDDDIYALENAGNSMI